MNDLQMAVKILEENNYTCVLFCEGKEYCSKLRGVKPLIDFLEAGYDLRGFSAADKVVGAGAAHLYALLGVKAVWARVMSDSAVTVLKQNKIKIYPQETVPYIINRAGNGNCPIENCVRGITDSAQALVKIKEELLTLR